MTTRDADDKRTFLRVAEYWRCDVEANALLLVDGYYSTSSAFGERRRCIAWPMGVGLIGRCALCLEPILSGGLSFESAFLRSEAALREGLSVGLAIPWPSRNEGLGVLSLFFGHTMGEPSGGVELWTRNDSSERLSLANAYHGLAEDFRRMSSLLNFELGEGLPGRVTQRELPEALRIVENPTEFLRAVAAETSGFVHAIGLPVAARYVSAVILLSHRKQPVALNIDIWQMQPNGVFERCADSSNNAIEPTDFSLNPQLHRASKSGLPITFKVQDCAQRQPYGGLILPYAAADGTSSACVLAW